MLLRPLSIYIETIAYSVLDHQLEMENYIFFSEMFAANHMDLHLLFAANLMDLCLFFPWET